MRGVAVFVGSVRRGVAAIAFAGLVTGCSGGSHEPATMTTATALAPVAQEIQHAVAKVWPESADIWPGTVLKDRLIILSDGKGAKLISVDGVTNLTPAKLAAKKVTIPSTGSSYATWDGHPAVVINAADPSYAADAQAANVGLSNALFQAATDEMFHSAQPRLGQAKQELRGTEFPLAVTPRLYRAMIYNDLLQAYQHPDRRRQWLGGAAYWNASWARAYPDEVKRAAATDVGEGAAGYFEGVATAMAMGADRDDRDELRKHVAFRPLDKSLDPGQLTLDGEGAALGGVAGLLLDETHKNWKKELNRGQTPLNLLLHGVAPVPEQPSDGLRHSIQDVLAKRNSDLIPRLNPLVSAYQDRSRPLLMIPLNAATGDLDAGGYYTAREVPYAMLAGLSGTFRLPSGTLKANEASVLAGQVGGRPYLIVPIEKKARDGSRKIRLDTRALSGTVGVTAQAAAGGRQALIAR
jgi:hypothetical protein